MLWSIRTTTTKPTGETPFFLVYGAEAVLPHKVKHRSARVLAFDETQQDAMRGMDVVLGGGGTSLRSCTEGGKVPASAAAIPLPQHLLQDARDGRPSPEAGPLQGRVA